MESTRVPLPPGVKPPFDVYLNAVAKTEGVDYAVADGAIIFPATLVKEGKLGFWRWFMGAWGIGTYRRNDVIDIRYEAGGQPQVAHDLPFEPPAAAGSADPAA
jgi:hypothetical protein